MAAIFGLATGLVVSWLVATCWAPVIDEAVAALPDTGMIEGGVLRWPERTGRLLAANPFTAVEVALQDFRPESAPVDVALELQPARMLVRTVFGNAAIPYPRNWRIELNRTALGPRWGAWKAPILFALIPGTALMLILSWSALALGYSLVVVLIGGMIRRDLVFASAWKLSLAAQLFGAVIMTFGIALYAAGQISLIFLAILFAAHWVPTIFFLLLSPFFVPKREAEGEKNPFDPGGKKLKGRRNPFSGKDDR